VRSNRLACPACSSRGVRPSSQWRPFDWLYRMLGRVPHSCLWCGKRSYLVPQGSGEELPEIAVMEASSATVTAPVTAREAPVRVTQPAYAEKEHLHHEKKGESLLKVATMVAEPESAPLPSPASDSPPMYVENGRLRLSGITLEQIQRRDSPLRRPGKDRNRNSA